MPPPAAARSRTLPRPLASATLATPTVWSQPRFAPLGLAVRRSDPGRIVLAVDQRSQPFVLGRDGRRSVAGLLAVRILATSDDALARRVAAFQLELAASAQAKDAALQQRIGGADAPHA